MSASPGTDARIAPSQADARSTPLLTTKLYIPPPPPNLVHRTRLIQRLNEGLRPGRRLTLVSAPAGFGKTMLLTEWASDCGVAWLSLDEEDNDPVRFLTYLVAAIKRVEADVDVDPQSLTQSPPLSSPKPALTMLINSLAAISTDLVLVLDDYHVITQQSIHDALTFLIDHLPPQMRLVVASRADPPWPLARLRTRGQLTEIRAADLRFTPEEAVTFLNDTMGLELSTKDVAALEARTEGWAAGLHLAALSMRGKAPEGIADFIVAFSGSNRHVIDYLAEEVMAQQPDEIHDFLCQTAILDRLTAALCDAVTGRGDSDEILRELEQTNLFLVPLDDQRKWYRYHRLFADFLRNHLRQDMPDLVRDLHCWAADWYERNGLATEAVGHVLKAGDFEWAARLIEQEGMTVLMHGEASRLMGWLETLPDEQVHARPGLCIAYAAALLVAGQVDAAETYLQDAEQMLQSGSSVTDSDNLLGQVSAIRAYLTVLYGNVRRGVELAHQAYRHLSEDDVFLRSMVAWLLGLTQYSTENGAAAEQIPTGLVESNQAAGNIFITLLNIYMSGQLQMVQGHLHQAAETFRQGLRLARTDSLASSTGGNEQPSLGVSLMYQGLGFALREQNELEEAERYLTECIELGEQWGNAEVLVDAYVFLAQLRQAQGDTGSALDAFHKARQIAQEHKVSPLTIRLVEAYHAQVWVAQGDLESAAQWAVSLERAQVEGDDSEQLVLYVNGVEQCTLARLLIAQRRFEQAGGVLRPLLREMERAGWMGLAIELLALQALALHRQGKTTEALTTLHRALSLAEPEGYVRVFLDEGAPMAELLGQAAARGMAAEYVNKLLAAFEKGRFRSQVPGSRLTTAPASTLEPEALIEPLTERELEVLRLVADGLSNREIAEALTIAVGTAKRHVSNIYAKLDVHSRVQAMSRAQELDLL